MALLSPFSKILCLNVTCEASDESSAIATYELAQQNGPPGCPCVAASTDVQKSTCTMQSIRTWVISGRRGAPLCVQQFVE